MNITFYGGFNPMLRKEGIEKTLDFTVERSGKTLVGSAASGEGLVNVYRGTGKVLLAPVEKYPQPMIH